MKIFPQKNGIYAVRYKKSHNKWQTQSTGMRNIADARRVIGEAGIREIEFRVKANILNSGANMATLGGGVRKTMDVIAEEYLSWMKGNNAKESTLNGSAIVLHSWIRYAEIGKEKPVNLQEQMLSQFINQKSEHKFITRSYWLSLIRPFFKWMLAKNYIPSDFSTIVNVDRNALTHEQNEPRERHWFSDEDYKKILDVVDADHADEFWKYAVRIGRKTALRFGDICCLQWASLKEKGVTVVWTRKRQKRVEIPESILEMLQSVQENGEPYIFYHQYLTYKDPTTRPALVMQFKRICEKAGVLGSFHSLRRAKLTEVANGDGIEQARRFAGHSSVETTKNYVL